MRLAALTYLAPLCLMSACASLPETAPTFGPPGYSPPQVHTPKTTDTKEATQLPAGPLTLDDTITLALAQHPSLTKHHATWQSMRHQAASLDRLQDPRLSYGFAPLPVETRLGAIRHTVSVSQMFPWPGQVDLMVHIEQFRAEAQRHLFNMTYLKVRHDVSQLYWSLWETQEHLKILAQSDTLLATMEGTLKVQVDLGQAPASRLSSLTLERLELREQIEAKRTTYQALQIQLHQALGHFAQTRRSKITLTTPPANTLPELTPEQALKGPPPPNLQALQEHIRRGQQTQQLAKLTSRPNFELGAQWSLIEQGDQPSQTGRDAVMLRFGLSVPLWHSSTAAKQDAALAQTTAFRAQYALELQSWQASVVKSHLLAKDALRRISLVQDTLLPQAKATFELSRADYETGQAEFSSMMKAFQKVVTLQHDLTTAKAQLSKQIATWETLLATPLEQENSP